VRFILHYLLRPIHACNPFFGSLSYHYRGKESKRSAWLAKCSFLFLLLVLTLLRVVQDAWQMPAYQCCMKYMSFPSPEALEENVITKRSHNLHDFISQPWILPLSPSLSLSFCPALLLYKAAAGFWDERHLFGSLQRVRELLKSLVLQSCSFPILYPIWRCWSKGSELREKLKDVYFGVKNNNNTNP